MSMNTRKIRVFLWHNEASLWGCRADAQACPCPPPHTHTPQYQQKHTHRLNTSGTSTAVVRRKCWAFTLRQLNPSQLMGQHQENCFCCSDEPLLFLLSKFLLSVRWLWAAHIPSASTEMSSVSTLTQYSVSALCFSQVTCYFLLFLPLFLVVFTYTCCWSSAKAISANHNPSFPFRGPQGRVTMKRSLLHVLRWLREMTFRPAEDGDGCRSRSERQCLMFCLTAFGVSSKWIFFGDAGRRPRSVSQACGTLSDLSFSWFTHHQHCNAQEEPEVQALGPLPCLWWVLITPSFRTWVVRND